MKALPQRQLAIPFVLDRHHRHHDVDTLNLRDIHALPDGRHAFRCAACLEPVGVRAGDLPATGTAPRTETDERDEPGDEGAQGRTGTDERGDGPERG